MTKNSKNILNLLLTTSLISASITSCQTTSAAGTKETVKALDAQVQLVEAVLKERESQKVQDAVKDNAELAKGEAHLRAALASLKASNHTQLLKLLADCGYIKIAAIEGTDRFRADVL